MTLLTPNFADQHRSNGAAGPAHVIAADAPPHEAASPTPARPLKIALIGTAPSSRMLAPFNDKTWTIWGCSPGNMNILPRVDAWFELHSNLMWPEHESYGKPYVEWLKEQKFPIYMQDQSLVPSAIVFPMYEMVAEFGCDFFTSSFAWQMALAIQMGATEIALYGIDMASRDEYIMQRPGFYYFRYMAMKRGIKVSAPHESDIMQSPALYAYVDSTPLGRKIRARTQEVNGRIAPMITQRDQLNHSITYLQGAKEDLDYFESIWSGVANEVGIMRAENAMLRAQIARLTAPAAMPKVVFEPVSASMQFNAGPIIPRRQRRRRVAQESPPLPTNEEPLALPTES